MDLIKMYDASDIYRVRESNDQLIVDSKSSIELKQTSRGVNFCVKVYDADPQIAFERATDLFEKCKQRYNGDIDDLD